MYAGKKLFMKLEINGFRLLYLLPDDGREMTPRVVWVFNVISAFEPAPHIDPLSLSV